MNPWKTFQDHLSVVLDKGIYAVFGDMSRPLRHPFFWLASKVITWPITNLPTKFRANLCSIFGDSPLTDTCHVHWHTPFSQLAWKLNHFLLGPKPTYCPNLAQIGAQLLDISGTQMDRHTDRWKQNLLGSGIFTQYYSFLIYPATCRSFRMTLQLLVVSARETMRSTGASWTPSLSGVSRLVV